MPAGVALNGQRVVRHTGLGCERATAIGSEVYAADCTDTVTAVGPALLHCPVAGTPPGCGRLLLCAGAGGLSRVTLVPRLSTPSTVASRASAQHARSSSSAQRASAASRRRRAPLATAALSLPTAACDRWDGAAWTRPLLWLGLNPHASRSRDCGPDAADASSGPALRPGVALVAAGVGVLAAASASRRFRAGRDGCSCDTPSSASVGQAPSALPSPAHSGVGMARRPFRGGDADDAA